MDKNSIRQECQKRLAAMDGAQRAGRSAAIAVFLLSLPEYRAARTVFCFAATKTEPNTMPFLRRALSEGKRVFLPRIVADGVMQAREITALSQLAPGRFGILEPPKDAPEAAPEELDLVVAPCVAMARNGVRLGHGKGYYDRFLAGRDGPCAALCFETTLYDDLPREAHDRPIACIITEKEICRVSALAHGPTT